MKKEFFIPAFRARDITPPAAVDMPELPGLHTQSKFSWLKTILFPSIQLAVLGGGIYLLFTIIMPGQGFHMGYMIAFMGLGMISSLICSVIEFFYSKHQNAKKNQAMTEEFNKKLSKAIAQAEAEGEDYAKRINGAYPPKDYTSLFSHIWRSEWMGERTNDDRITVRIGSVRNAPNPAGIIPGKDLSNHPLAEDVLSRIKKSQTIKLMPLLLNCDEYRCISVTGQKAESVANAIVGELLAAYAPERVHVMLCGNGRSGMSDPLPVSVSYGSAQDAMERIRTVPPAQFLLIQSLDLSNAELDQLYRVMREASARVCLLVCHENHAPVFSECNIHVESLSKAELTFPFAKSVEMVPEWLYEDTISQQLFPLLAQYADRGGLLAGGGQLPDRLSLFQFMNLTFAFSAAVSRISSTWKQCEGAGLSVAIGQGAGGIVSIDFTGCRGHGIVAGMTGSGKSQFLLSMVALLCAKYSPDLFSFAMIDFKGDASSMQLKGLPHFAGALSDLDGSYQLKRVLIMLEAESKRRQRLLNKAKEEGLIAVNEIEYYQEKYCEDKTALEAMPYLLVIVDEFVDAKQSDNSFLDNIACIARQGRSRGIYLLLSAQNPAPQIGGQIAANIGYDICFKVRDDSISRAIIDQPDAAYIKPDQRGRGYLLTDRDGLLEFQTPYGGDLLGTGSPAVTQMEGLVAAIKQVAKDQGRAHAKLVFEPPLPDEMIWSLSTRIERAKCPYPNVTIPIGISDNIYVAKMDRAEVPLYQGNVMICGNPGMGKTTLLQSMLFMGSWLYTTDELQFWVCSFGLKDSDYRSFDQVPNVVHTITFEDNELLERLVPRLQREIEYRRKVPLNHPKLVIMIDGLDTLYEEKPTLANRLMMISKNSFALGVHFVFSTATANVLPLAYRQSITTWMSFKLDNDPYEHYFPLRDIKAPVATPGRMLFYQRGSYTKETQAFAIALPGHTGDTMYDQELESKVREIVPTVYEIRNLIRIEKIPDMVTFREVEYCRDLIPVGIDWDYPFDPVGYHFKESPFFVVSGDDNSIVMHRMVRYLLRQRNFDVRQIIVVDPLIQNNPFENLSDPSMNILVYGAAELDEGINAVDKYDKTGNGYTFIFLCNFAMLRSRVGDASKKILTVLGSQAGPSSRIYDYNQVRFILSDSANALLDKGTVASISSQILSYNRGLALGGTTKDRWGISGLSPRNIPDGYGYLYDPHGQRSTKLYRDD